jgi:hypothetical protein
MPEGVLVGQLEREQLAIWCHTPLRCGGNRLKDWKLKSAQPTKQGSNAAATVAC